MAKIINSFCETTIGLRFINLTNPNKIKHPANTRVADIIIGGNPDPS